jgi:hypothetical protein
MTKLYTDCTTDAERAEYFRDGSAREAGIVAQAIQQDVADAFDFRAKVTDALAALRSRLLSQFISGALGGSENYGRNKGLNASIDELDATMTELGLAPKEKQ